MMPIFAVVICVLFLSIPYGRKLAVTESSFLRRNPLPLRLCACVKLSSGRPMQEAKTDQFLARHKDAKPISLV